MKREKIVSVWGWMAERRRGKGRNEDCVEEKREEQRKRGRWGSKREEGETEHKKAREYGHAVRG